MLFRKEKGMIICECAEFSRVRPSLICQLENGKANFTIVVFEQLAIVLVVSLFYCFFKIMLLEL